MRCTQPDWKGSNELTRIFLIRHAEAEGNIFRRAHGHFNGQVIGRGHAQIGQLKERFKNETIDAVYSSDLSRTMTTASAICDAHGLSINATERLREIKVGEWEDVAWGDIIFRYPEMSGFFGSDPARWTVDGSEDYMLVRERMKNCVTEIGRRHEGGSVAVFSHGFAIRAFLCELKGIPSHKTELVPYCDNTAVALLNYSNDDLSVVYHGDNSHLSGENSTFATQTWWRDQKERKNEDIRYSKVDANRDAALLELCGNKLCANSPDGILFIALLGNEPIGILELDTGKEHGDGVGWISLLFVMPEFRRVEYEVQLLGQAVSEFRKLRRYRLRATVVSDEQLLAFSTRFGFTKISESDSLCTMEKNIRNW